MARLPIVEKNAYLTVQLTHNSICANLSYSHYDIGRHYVLHDETYFDPEIDDAFEQAFWEEYFSELETKFSWDILNSTKTKVSMATVEEFRDEGCGVAGISLVTHKDLPNRVKIKSAIHSFLPTARLLVQADSEIEKFLPELTSKLGYKNIIYINADLEKFDIVGMNTHKEDGSKDGELVSTKIYWESKQALISSLRDKKIRAFSSIDMESDSHKNLWANFVSRSVTYADDYELHDILRSFLTVQLSTVLRNKPQIKQNKSEGSGTRLVVIEGLLARLLEKKELVISILDGLEMSGDFDLLIDKNGQFMSFGQMYADGINARDYIVPVSSVVEELDYVAVIEVPGRKSGKAVFNGTISYQGKEKYDVYMLSSEFRQFNIKKHEEKVLFSGKPMGNAGFDNFKTQEIVLSSDPEEKKYKSIFIDARFKPVVYGPDYRTNKDKLNVWTNE